jgi:hypothetical protein
MSNVIPLEHHQYDLLLGKKNPMALRLNDAEHQNIQVGDLVEFSGHDTIMDRERFKVVGKMNHPSIASAMSTIEHSSLDTRDKIQMEHAFMDVHGPEAAHHEVVSLHLAPHPAAPGASFNRGVGSLG